MASAAPPDSLQSTSPPPGKGGEGLDSAVKQQVSATLGEQQQAAAAGIGQFAQALRKAAHEGGGERNATVENLAESAAQGLDRVSQTLRSKDLDTMVREVESFARSQPMVFLGTAVAVGFLAFRFLKSSSPENR